MKLQDFRDMGKITPTRFQQETIKLYIYSSKAGQWRYVIDQDGDAAQTGPCFKTKMEAFCALHETAKSWGLTD